MPTAAHPTLDLDEHARLFHALSDARRLRILAALGEGELCVCDLQERLGMAQSLLSFHLRTLREVGMVSVRREGRWAHYRLAQAGLDHAGAALGDLSGIAEPSPAPACCT